MTSNKLLKTIVFSLVGLAVFLTGFVLTRKSVENQQALINNSLVARFDQPEERRAEPTGVFAISRDKANFTTLANGGKEIWYYNADNGEIRYVPADNLAGGTKLVAKIQPGASRIGWGQNKTLVAQYTTGAIFFDLNANYSKNYGSLIKSPSLNKAGDKVVYNYFNAESKEGNVSVADPRIEHFKNVLPTRFESWQTGWLDNDTLALTKPPTLDNLAASLFVLSVDSGGLQTILDSRKNLETAWSPSGGRVLYSHYDISTEENGLFVMNLSDKQETSLGQIWDASKCVWSIDNKTVYCATKSGFYSLDTTSSKPAPQKVGSGTATDLAAAAANASGLVLTSAEDYLIFKNLKDGKLYGMKVR